MFITADRIHNGIRWLPGGTTLHVAGDGSVVDILPAPTAATIHHAGTLSPGFVNAHCHLELSHMKGVVPEHTGLIPFLQAVMQHRNTFLPEAKEAALKAAISELLLNGVVAVGDIANTADLAAHRESSGLLIHTFVESLGFIPENAGKSLCFAESTLAAYNARSGGAYHLTQSITPHAPYSVSEPLFRLIDNYNTASLLSIHNQESIAENTFYEAKEGAVLDLLAGLGIDYSGFQPTGLHSLPSYLGWLTYNRTFIFVHNTFTTAEDIHYAAGHIKNAYWCLCPNANLYIENKLPDVPLLVREGQNMCIGTDSLASNHSLSILSELQTLNRNFPELGWERLLHWGTLQGAKALGMDGLIGSFEIGKRPGVLLLGDLEGGGAVTRLV